jgi:hypothetical protein
MSKKRVRIRLLPSISNNTTFITVKSLMLIHGNSFLLETRIVLSWAKVSPCVRSPS